jgi:DNA-binding IclR family transcriptional regulator
VGAIPLSNEPPARKTVDLTRGKTAGATVPAAVRTMTLFEVFAQEKRALTKSEVARLLDLPESSSSDLLNTLHSIGYLNRTVSQRRFYPTARLLGTANSISVTNVLPAFGAEATALLADLTGETACCAVVTDGGIEVIAVSEGRHRLRYVLDVGDRFTIHGTALGKALMGALDDEEMGRLLRLRPLPRRTDATKVSPQAIEEEIRVHRELGWYQTADEGHVGVSGLSVSGSVGNDAVGLGILGPTERMRTKLEEHREVILRVRESVFGL